jgi:hypothetical protein
MKCFQIKITQTMYSQRVLDKWTESSVLKRPPFAAANAGKSSKWIFEFTGPNQILELIFYSSK